MNPVHNWFFRQQGWAAFPFQKEAWAAHAQGESGLINAPTGMGKTYAAWLPPLARWCEEHPDSEAWAGMNAPPLTVLWITPLRALATDTAATLIQPVEALGLPWSVQMRTGDTPQSLKTKQNKRLPTALVTTPESLSVLLSYADAREKFKHLQAVVVDEWHELMSSKRGTQTELGLARVRQFSPTLQTWGLSATLGNLEQARDALLGVDARRAAGRLIRGEDQKRVAVTTVIPSEIERFPWAGHLGLHLLQDVIQRIDAARSTLLFTNTRSQSELWFSAIVRSAPSWVERVALHHGSINRDVRRRVEGMLRAGELRCVVCTSSLDLGVDFSPVDQVIQVGSPKGVGRLMQRAGRSGHQPGGQSRLVGVPTHAMELVEFAAARDAADARNIEARPPRENPLDVLVQHLVTVGMGGGFDDRAMLQEVRTTYAFRDLSDEAWGWCLDFVKRGGPALTAYPQYARLIPDPEDPHRLAVASPQIARLHRMGIGTITSDTAITVKYQRGGRIGMVEESFIGRISPGDKFVFAGLMLELVRVRGMVATVRRAKGNKATVPVWQGGRSPLSTQLADAVRTKLQDAREGRYEDPEMRAVEPLLRMQQAASRIPAEDELLVERIRTREGHHVFLFPFQGRLVHEGLGALIAHRLARLAPRSINVVVNDYGLELLSETPFELDDTAWRDVLSEDRLLEDLLECLNESALARRQFRDIARIAGLVFQGYPGQGKSTRQLQASSELFFDVFSEFDPENMLLGQARREVLQQQLEVGRLRAALGRLSGMRLAVVDLARLSPLAFPLWAEHLREQHVSTEKWSDRVRRMAVQLEASAEDADNTSIIEYEPPGKPERSGASKRRRRMRR